MQHDDDDDDDLSLLRACEAHLVRLETQRRDLSEDSPFLHRVMMGLGDADDPSKSSSASSVVEAMRRDTEKGIERFRRVRAKLENKSLSTSRDGRRVKRNSDARDRIKAFKTDEIYLMFFEKDRDGLRDRLRSIERELKLDRWKRKKETSWNEKNSRLSRR